MYDFSRLHANILNNTLKNMMREPINFCFKNGKNLVKHGPTKKINSR